MIEIRFRNEYIDSTVAVQEDGSVIERYGVGGVVVTRPQTYASVEEWLDEMERDTSMCSHDPRDDYGYDEEDDDPLLWFIPTAYSCGGRTAENTPDGCVVEGSRFWADSEEWANDVIAAAKKVDEVGGAGVGVSGSHSNDDISSTMNANTMKIAPIRRSTRLAKKPAVNYAEVDEEVAVQVSSVSEKTRPKTPVYLIASGSVATITIPASAPVSLIVTETHTPAPFRRSSRLAKKPAVNYAEVDEVVAEVVGPLPAPVPEKPVVTETVTSTPTPTPLTAEEKRICDHIKGCLERTEKTTGKAAKATIAVELFHFIAAFAKEFSAKHKRWSDTVIAKAYEFKKYEPERIALVEAADKVLLALGAQVEIPVPLPVILPPGICTADAGAYASRMRAEMETSYQKLKADKVAEAEKAAAISAASAALTAAAASLTAAVNA